MRKSLVPLRLARLHDALAGYVERGEIPGLVALVSQSDDVHVDAIGLPRDAIFRIASITKPITAAAAMILVEECRIRLDDAVDPWLPELANRRVLRSLSSELDDTEPARRPITLRHLLTSTMGFGSVMAPPDAYPIQKRIRELRIGGDGPPHPPQMLSLDEWLRNLGSLPWLAHPGERWFYHVSLDVLGALISRVSGQSLGDFLRERIFEPLQMKDTGFFVPPKKAHRLPPCYAGEMLYDAGGAESEWATPPPAESGGGGLVSTVDDYFAFCRMMLRHGEPILSRSTVQLMTVPQVSSDQRKGMDVFFRTHSSWGFGVAVDIHRAEPYHHIGRFGWTGGLGTTAYADPFNDVIGILLTQKVMQSPEPPPVFSDFWTLAYGAVR